MVEFLRLLSGSVFGISILFIFYFGFHYAFYTYDFHAIIQLHKKLRLFLILMILSTILFVICKYV